MEIIVEETQGDQKMLRLAFHIKHLRKEDHLMEAVVLLIM